MVKKSDNNDKKPSKEKKKGTQKRVDKQTKTKKTEPIPQKKNKNKSKFIRKRIFILFSIIILICIIGFIWIILIPEAAQAQLIIESGSIQIKHAGESWISASNGTLLYPSDTVRTGNNSYASIILFKSSIIRLGSNTEVTIQEILQQEGKTSVKIQQDIGRTWNTISKISGIDSYDVQTPTTIASVRGTTLDINVTEVGNTSVKVINGSATVSRVQNGTITESIEVDENESVIVYSDTNKSLETEPFEPDNWISNNQQKDKELRGNIKEELYKKIEPYIPQLKDEFGVTDEELDVLIDGYINGYFDLPADTPEWIRELIEFS